MKQLKYLLFVMAVIWVGLFLFYKDMDGLSRIIFYLVTAWLLLLIVLIVKQVIKNRKNPK